MSPLYLPPTLSEALETIERCEDGGHPYGVLGPSPQLDRLVKMRLVEEVPIEDSELVRYRMTAEGRHALGRPTRPKP